MTRSVAPVSTWHLVRIGDSGSHRAEVILAGPPLCWETRSAYCSNQAMSRSRGGPSWASALSTAPSTFSTQLCMTASMRASRLGKCR